MPSPVAVVTHETLYKIYLSLREEIWERLRTIATVPYHLACGNYVRALEILREGDSPPIYESWLRRTGILSLCEVDIQAVSAEVYSPEKYPATIDPKRWAQDRLAEAAVNSETCPWGIWGHYKGGSYVLVTASLEENTLTPMITYSSSLYGSVMTRTWDDWFAPVMNADHETVPRFQRHQK